MRVGEEIMVRRLTDAAHQKHLLTERPSGYLWQYDGTCIDSRQAVKLIDPQDYA